VIYERNATLPANATVWLLLRWLTQGFGGGHRDANAINLAPGARAPGYAAMSFRPGS
jgi:hypothetical protein